jgi:tetratricopeptide (TPR) repeat protein
MDPEDRYAQDIPAVIDTLLYHQSYLKSHPKNIKSFEQLGVAYFKLRRYDEAKKYLNYVLLIEKNNITAKNILDEIGIKESKTR